MKAIEKIGLAGFVLSLLVSCTSSRPTVTQLIPDPPLFMLAHPLRYEANNGQYEIIVPFGFITDLASIPKGLWWWESPHQATMAPAMLHDYLYWQQTCTKDESDAVMFLAMGDVGLSSFRQRAVYTGVRTPFAQSAWNRNQESRNSGESRFFTNDYAYLLMDSIIDASVNMAEIQKEAVSKGGMYLPSTVNPALKSACEAALIEFNSQFNS